MPLSNPASGASLTSVYYTLGGDVTMTNGDGTRYDGPSGSFSAGTWLVLWKIEFKSNGSAANDIAIRLWDGSTVYDELQHDVVPAQNLCQMPYSGHVIITLASTATLKVSAMSFRAGYTIVRDTAYDSGSSHTASSLMGVKLA